MDSTGGNARSMIDQNSVVRRKPELISAASDEEVVVLDAEHGHFLQLNKTAAEIWGLLEEPIAVSAICDAMSARFAITLDDCRDDIVALLAALAARGLVEVTDPAGQQAPR